MARASEQEISFVAWKELNVLANLWQTVHWNLCLLFSWRCKLSYSLISSDIHWIIKFFVEVSEVFHVMNFTEVLCANDYLGLHISRLVYGILIAHLLGRTVTPYSVRWDVPWIWYIMLLKTVCWTQLLNWVIPYLPWISMVLVRYADPYVSLM